MNGGSGVRGIGGILVGVAVAMIAEHVGMPRWQVIAVAVLIGVGLPLAISGKWRNF
jgi:zinc transporter ZupT